MLNGTVRRASGQARGRHVQARCRPLRAQFCTVESLGYQPEPTHARYGTRPVQQRRVARLGYRNSATIRNVPIAPLISHAHRLLHETLTLSAGFGNVQKSLKGKRGLLLSHDVYKRNHVHPESRRIQSHIGLALCTHRGSLSPGYIVAARRSAGAILPHPLPFGTVRPAWPGPANPAAGPSGRAGRQTVTADL